MRGSSGLREIEPRLRGAALFPLAAYLVHQLRYLLAAEGDAGHQLESQGHAYLSWLTVPVTLLAASAAGAFAAHLAVARREGGEARVARARVPWLVVAGALLAVYVGQELLEGALASGHPGGLVGVLGGGGWIAIPASLAVGAVVALLLRAAEGALRLVGARAPRVGRSAAPARPSRLVDLRRAAPLAVLAAGRAPPVFAPAH
jgi:hypothetical protein